MVPGTTLSLLFDVFVVSQKVRELQTVAMADAPLRPEEYAITSAVLELGPLSTSDLARHLGMPVTTAHDHVRNLLARGHGRRRRHTRDRRAWLIELSADGHAVHRESARLFDAAIRHLLPALTVDESDARQVLAAIALACDRATEVLRTEAADATG